MLLVYTLILRLFSKFKNFFKFKMCYLKSGLVILTPPQFTYTKYKKKDTSNYLLHVYFGSFYMIKSFN